MLASDYQQLRVYSSSPKADYAQKPATNYNGINPAYQNSINDYIGISYKIMHDSRGSYDGVK